MSRPAPVCVTCGDLADVRLILLTQDTGDHSQQRVETRAFCSTHAEDALEALLVALEETET